jgi:P4 family phage/plasmid primase-like protien
MTHKSHNFEEYLKSHNAIKGTPFTNTRIGDKDLNIYGGSYTIPSTEWINFMKKYYNHIFVQGKQEYLTEKQLIEDGPILVDIDFKYTTEIKEKQHSEDHIIDMVMLYADKITELVSVKNNIMIDVFVLEKNNVNILQEKTKDGIHIIFGIKMHKSLQVLLRNKVIQEIKAMWDDLPITNSWEEVFDEGVTKGFVNWQMYGSRKPGHLAYMIKYHYEISYNNDTWDLIKNPIEKFNTEKYIEKLSARYTDHPEFDIKDEVKDDFEKTKESLSKNTSSNASTKSRQKSKFTISSVSSDNSTIDSEKKLNTALELLFEDVGINNYCIKETHQYTMTLPETYYGPGSYTKWIRVGWALAATDQKLFLTWVKFSSQENCRDTLKGTDGKFDWKNVPELFNIWNGFQLNNPDSLSYRSIIYWSKRDALEKYNIIRKSTIDFYIQQTVQTPTEFDIASVLFNLYKDSFVCASITNNIWYEYNNKHRWVINDSGNSLRKKISTEMHQIYVEQTQDILLQINALNDPSSEAADILRKKSKTLSEISIYLKRTTWKNNVMKEAKELFFVNNFIENLDQNLYLLNFNNYVIDFKNKTYRKGQPDDFLSKSTNIDYTPLKDIKDTKTIDEINLFMEQLFPIKELRDYMWEHAASCLIGTTINQTFHIYIGNGRNGKTKFVDLLGIGLGEYKAIVPLSLITQKRTSIGATSSEVAQLNAVRYAVMQEPSKGDKINEGIMKEITGGDPIQARALFKDTITFKPQFNLAVCTNTEFKDLASDDGTWRRIRQIDFMAKFLENPYEDPMFPKSDFLYQFAVDKQLDMKFSTWAPVFMSMLVEKVFVLQGVVHDCSIVMNSSNDYRERQDYFSGFAKDMIRYSPSSKIKKSEVFESFKLWYSSNYGNRGMPSGKEIYEFMDKKYGDYKIGWRNVAINYDDKDPIDIMINT